jgi:phage-related protein
MLLPDLNNERDTAVLADALQKALAPIVEEMTANIEKTMRAAPPEKSDVAKFVHAMEYSMDGIRAAILELTAKDVKPPSSDEIVNMIDSMNEKSEEERRDLISVLLTNGKFQNEVLSKLDKGLFLVMNESLDELLKVTKDKEKLERKERDEEKRAKNKKESEAKAKIQAKEESRPMSLRDVPNLIDDLVDGLKNLGVLFGAVGLFSMLPKKVQEFIGDFTATFTYIRELMQNSFLAPVLKLLERLPVLGPLIRKLPVITAFVAAFEIIPDVLARYSKDGIWKAIETGLIGVYKFFVEDVLKLVSQFSNWIQEKMFGGVFVDLTDAIDVLGEHARQYALDFVATIKSFLTGDWKGVLSGVGALAEDVINAFVNVGLSIFKLPANWDTSEKIAELWGTITDYVGGLGAGITSWVSGLVDGLTDYVSDKWRAATGAIDDFGGWMSGLIDGMISFVSDKWNSAVNAVDDFGGWMSGLIDGLISFVSDKWNAALTWGEETGAWMAGLWTSLTTYVSDKWNAALTWGEDTETLLEGLWTSFTTFVSDRWTSGIVAAGEAVGDVGSYFASMWTGVTSWVKEKWDGGMSAIKDVTEDVGGIFSDLWTAIKNKISSVFDEAVASLTGLKDVMAKWFETVVKKTVNYILDYLPMGIGEGMKFDVTENEPSEVEVAPARPVTELEKRMVTTTQRIEKARDDRMPTQSRSASVKIDNSRQVSTQSYVVQGSSRASPRSPLNGGSGY